MRVVKVLNKNKIYLNKKGEERYSTSYYIECDNDKKICIKPVFDNDYSTLDFISDLIIIERKELIENE